MDQGRGGGGGGGAASGEYFVRMRGIPFHAREREIIEFFSRTNVLPMGVSVVYNQRDQPTGEVRSETL